MSAGACSSSALCLCSSRLSGESIIKSAEAHSHANTNGGSEQERGEKKRKLALGPLSGFASFLEAELAALFHAGITLEVALLLEDTAELAVPLNECTRKRVTHGFCLGSDAATGDFYGNLECGGGLREVKRGEDGGAEGVSLYV